MDFHLDRRSSLGTTLLALLFATTLPCLSASSAITVERLNPVLRTQADTGSAVTFRATVTPSADLSLQWYCDDQPLPGATAATLNLASVTPADTGNYRLQFIDATNTATWSNTIPLTVLPAPTSPVDHSFSASFPADVASAQPLLALSDGGVIVRETLTTSATRYARLLPSGARDPAFNVPISAGTILAADTTSIFSTVAPYRRTFDGSSAPLVLPAAFDLSQPLAAALIQPDSRFLLAQGTTLVRFTAAGAVDTTFAAPVSANSILWLRLDPQNRLLVARALPGNAGTALERLSSTGALDPTFVPPNELPYTTAARFAACNDLFPLPTGGYIAELLGTSFIRLQDDGSLDPQWVLYQTTSFYPRSFEFQTAVAPDGTLFVTSILAGGTFRRETLSAHFYSESVPFYPGFPSDTSDLGFAYSGPLLPTTDGHLFVSGDFNRWDDHATRFIAKLDGTSRATIPPALSISVLRASTTVSDTRFHAGENLTLWTSITGATTGSPTWVALDGQSLPSDHHTFILGIPNFSSAHAGRYQLRLPTDAGVILSNIVTLGFDADPIYLADISGRAVVGPDEATPIAGFVVPGASRLLLRGVGPTLESYGLAHPLATPVLQLQSNGSTSVTRFEPAALTAEVANLSDRLGASPLLAASFEVAAIFDAPTGPSTVSLTGRNATETGVALAEVYATEPTTAPVNLSFRARTAPGDDTAIAGFVLADPGAASPNARVLLRAVGPTLADQGVTAPLADPVLTVYNAAGEVVAQNDNWPWHMTTDYNAFDAATDHVGAFHLRADSKDAALLLDLPAGAYTLHATAADGSAREGVVLLEIYLVP